MTINPRVGGPNALSWVAFWVVLAASVIVNLPDRYTTWTLASSWRNLLCNVIAVAAMFGVMWVLKALVLRDAAVRPRPWRAVGIFAVGAVVRALVLAALLSTIGEGEAVPAFRIVSSLTILVPLLVITAGLVDLLRVSAARRAALQAEAVELIAAEESAQAKTAALQQGAIARVRTLLLEHLEAVRGDRSAALEADLRQDVEQVIRPMSHRLFVEETRLAPAPSAPPPARVRWSDVWRSASLGRPFRPVALASFLAVASLNALVNFNQSAPRGLLYTVAEWVLAYAVVALLGRLLTGPMRRMRVGLRTATLVVASIGGMILVATLLATLIDVSGGAAAWRVPIAVMLLGPIVAWALSIDQGFRTQVAAADAEQATANAGLRVAAALAGALRRDEERRLSRALHGPVQTAVTAAAMRIEAGDDAGAEAMLVDAVGQLDLEAHGTAPVVAALADVAALWDGLCTVRIDLEPGLDRAIDARPTMAGVFIDICIEACSNAVRHGGARSVVVRAAREGDALQLEVRDDGASTGPQSHDGLGDTLLDDVALSWERYRDGGSTVLRATLPLAS